MDLMFMDTNTMSEEKDKKRGGLTFTAVSGPIFTLSDMTRSPARSFQSS